MRQRQRLCLISRSAFPTLKMSRFQVQVEFDANRKASGEVLFPNGNGSWELIEDQKHWSPHLGLLWVCNKMGLPLSAVTTTAKQTTTPASPSNRLLRQHRAKHRGSLQQAVEDLRNTNGLFRHQVQADIHQDADQIHTSKVREEVVGQA